MTADLSALIDRLEAAEVGSRELDEAVWLACGFERKIGGPIDAAGNGVWEGPHVSHFLDAALALADRVLPGWSCSAIKGQCGCEAYVWPHAEAFADIQGKSSTPALALCIAILRAKQGEKT